MDPADLASNAVGLLIPYLRHVGEKAAGTIAERAAGQAVNAAYGLVGRLHQALKAWLQHDSYEAAQLEGVEANPNSPARQAALVCTLTEYLDLHPELTAELEQFVTSARQAGAPVLSIAGGITAGGNLELHAGGDITGRDRTA